MIIFLYGGTNMRLSSGWEQSVYVLLMLDQLPEGKYINTISLSERLEVSDSYLKKIIKLLLIHFFQIMYGEMKTRRNFSLIVSVQRKNLFMK